MARSRLAKRMPVERAVTLRDRERVVVAEHQHVRGEADVGREDEFAAGGACAAADRADRHGGSSAQPAEEVRPVIVPVSYWR